MSKSLSKVDLLIYVSEFPPGPGGMGELAYQTAKELARRGLKICVICSQDYVDKQDILHFNNSAPFEVVSFSSRGQSILQALNKSWTLFRLILKHKPSLVMTSGTIPTLLSWPVSFVLNFNKITIIHGPEFQVQFGQNNWLIRKILAPAKLVAVSEYSRQFILKHISPQSVQVLNNGAKIPDASDHKLIESLKASYKDKTVLMTVGRMCFRKGQENVIRALPKLINKHPDLVYLLIGHEEQKSYLESLSHELNVQDHVYFIGQIPSEHLGAYLSLCDIYLLMSQRLQDGDFEGFGISIIEAALLGKPAIGSNDSGIADAIVHEATGLLIPSKDEAKLIAAINTLIKDPNLRKSLGEQAQTRALNNFTWEKYGEKFIAMAKAEFQLNW